MKTLSTVLLMLVIASSAVGDPSKEVQQLIKTPATVFDVYLGNQLLWWGEILKQDSDNDRISAFGSTALRLGLLEGNDDIYELYKEPFYYKWSVWYDWDDNLIEFKTSGSIILEYAERENVERHKLFAENLVKCMKGAITDNSMREPMRRGWSTEEFDEKALIEHLIKRMTVSLGLEFAYGELGTSNFEIVVFDATMDQHDKVTVLKRDE